MNEEKKRVYSWSRLNAFHDAINGDGCLYGWFKTYIEGNRGSGNFFSEYGTLFHTLIEEMNNGSIYAWDINDKVKQGLESFEFRAPFFNMKKSYENAIYSFFENFESIFSDYTIQQAEEEKVFNIGDVVIRGFPDIVGQHKTAGMFIGDFKSSKPYVGDDLKHKVMQMYLYSIPFYNEYSYYPDSLIYMFLREKGEKELIIKFDLKDLERTKKWVLDTVKLIEEFEGEYIARCATEDTEKNFYVNNLCNHRLNCEHRCRHINSVKAV